jgi:hypothetical protein
MNPLTSSKMGRKRSTWQKHIEEWQQSGLSQQKYCGENGIALATFGYWRRKLKTEQPEKPRFYPLIVGSEEPPEQKDSKNTGLRLVLCEQRFTIEIDESFSPTVLEKLVTTLERL